MQNTNTILIASPPLNMSPTRSGNNVTAEEIAKAKEGRGFENYISKKAFAEKVMQIAAEYEGTGRVAGLDGWKMLVDKALEAQGRSEEEEAEKYAEEKMPGCGIPGATGFPEGWYRDAIHLGPKVSEAILLEEMPLGEMAE